MADITDLLADYQRWATERTELIGVEESLVVPPDIGELWEASDERGIALLHAFALRLQRPPAPTDLAARYQGWITARRDVLAVEDYGGGAFGDWAGVDDDATELCGLLAEALGIDDPPCHHPDLAVDEGVCHLCSTDVVPDPAADPDVRAWVDAEPPCSHNNVATIDTVHRLDGGEVRYGRCRRCGADVRWHLDVTNGWVDR